MIRAVLFDYGHTLVDFTVPEDALHEVYAGIRERLVREAKMELPEAVELVDLVARGVTRRVDESYASDRLVELDIIELFTDSLRGLGFMPEPETVRWVAETEHEALTAHLVVPEDSLETLAQLKEMGLSIGIISNAHLLPYMMRRDWQNLGIAQHVDGAIISSEIGIRKPHPEIFRRALLELAVEPEDAVFVGDRLLDDVGGAHAVGMSAILTQQFRQETVEPDGPQPDFVVSHLLEMMEFVRRLHSPAVSLNG